MVHGSYSSAGPGRGHVASSVPLGRRNGVGGGNTGNEQPGYSHTVPLEPGTRPGSRSVLVLPVPEGQLIIGRQLTAGIDTPPLFSVPAGRLNRGPSIPGNE